MTFYLSIVSRTIAAGTSPWLIIVFPADKDLRAL
jgi:hypothetical protein